MSRKLIIDVDPGIGDAIAAVVAMLDPELDVLALTATPGCVSGEQATTNLQAIVEQLDASKWPRVGAASPSSVLEVDDVPALRNLRALNGPTGLGDWQFQVAELHHRKESSKLLIDLVRTYPYQVTLLTLGPLFNVSAACERDPEFLGLLEGLYCLGGAVSDGGDVTAAAEFNVFLNPEAARNVLRGPERKMLIPLDVTNKVTLTFEHFNRLQESSSRGARFLQRLLPYAFRAHHQYLGMEGILLREVVALAAVAQPQLFKSRRMSLDIETSGDLTRGMTVFDRRPFLAGDPNIEVATDVEAQGVLDYLLKVLSA